MPTPPSTIDERANLCFGCGPANPHGLHLTFEVDALTLTATTHFQLSSFYQGAPGFLHGGIIATLLDEAMSKLSRPLDVLAVTRHLAVDYLRPVPIDTPLTLRARHLRRESRKLFHAAEILSAQSEILARAEAVFLILQPGSLDS
jgi:uncharacterized protein (TIGR00369 family)